MQAEVGIRSHFLFGFNTCALPIYPQLSAIARGRARLARPWSGRCYGVARHREGSRQNSIGDSGVLSLRHFGLVLLIRWRVGAEGIWRGEILVYWLRRRDAARPARAAWAGPRLQAARCRGRRRRRRRFSLGLLISGPRITLNSHALRARGRCWPGRGLPVATGSLGTARGRAKTALGPALSLSLTLCADELSAVH